MLIGERSKEDPLILNADLRHPFPIVFPERYAFVLAGRADASILGPVANILRGSSRTEVIASVVQTVSILMVGQSRILSKHPVQDLSMHRKMPSGVVLASRSILFPFDQVKGPLPLHQPFVVRVVYYCKPILTQLYSSHISEDPPSVLLRLRSNPQDQVVL